VGGGLEWEPIELADADGDQVEWIDEGEVGSGPDRYDGRLPPPTTWNRAAASLLALALFAAGLGASAVTAYNRHVADRRIANLLDLQSGPDAPSIPGLAQLGFDSAWQPHVAERVSFAVVNRSPRPVTLMSATIAEQGLVTSTPLAPVGNRTLLPGQSGALAGTVTADCTQEATAQSIDVTPRGEIEGEFTVPQLSVLARTSGGMIGVSRLDPETSSQQNLQQRICLQQGYTLLTDDKFDVAVNPDTRTITVRLSARAAVDETMQYSASTAYSDDPMEGVPGLTLSPLPLAASAVDGVAKPGGEISVAYMIKVSSCPVGTLRRTDQVQIEFDVSVDDVSLPGLMDSTDLDPLIEQACGNQA